MSITKFIKTYSCDAAIITSLHGIDYSIIAQTKQISESEAKFVETHALPSLFPPGLDIKFAIRSFDTPKRACISFIFKVDKDEFNRDRYCVLSVLFPRELLIFCLDPRTIFDQIKTHVSPETLKNIKTIQAATSLDNKLKEISIKIVPMTKQEITNYHSLLQKSGKILVDYFNEHLELIFSVLLHTKKQLVIVTDEKKINLKTIWAENSSAEIISKLLTVLPPPLRANVTFSSVAYDINSEISRIIFTPPDFIPPRNEKMYEIIDIREEEKKKIRISKESRLLAELIRNSADGLTDELELLHLFSLTHYLLGKYKKRKEFSRILKLMNK